MLDKFKDECGVFGIFGHHESANMTYLGLYALQHRGQESAGIAVSDGKLVRVSKAMGYVADVFDGLGDGAVDNAGIKVPESVMGGEPLGLFLGVGDDLRRLLHRVLLLFLVLGEKLLRLGTQTGRFLKIAADLGGTVV